MTPVRFLKLCSCSALAATSFAAEAQELDRATPLLEAPKEYQAKPVQLGNIAAYLGGDARIEYDSNIYALPSNEIDDVRVTVTPRVDLRMNNDRFNLNAEARAIVRRYFDHQTENSEAGMADLGGSYRFSDTDTLNANIGWSRVVEQRGEPESRTDPATSPRKYNQLHGELGFNHVGSRITIGVKGSALRNNALASIDEERDYDQYSGVARVGYRVSGVVNAFGEGFVTFRNFDLPVDSSGIDRDSKTYGGRVGVSFEPGGLISGEAAVGMYRFNPEDVTLDSHSGTSVSAALVYTPAPRWVVTLDGFRGDVATVRAGAQSRTDTRFRLGVQNEIYHNLRWQGSVIYRRTNFSGVQQHERTIAGLAEIEYLLNHNLAFALMARIASRNSTRPTDDFDRSILGAEVRFQY